MTGASPSASMPELDPLGCPLEGRTLIEASAGTGKTWTLCCLYLRLLLERGLAVEQVLVVTFTTAATAELRERIRARIDEALRRARGVPAAPAGDDGFVDALLARLAARGIDRGEVAGRLDLALRSFDSAAIHTIHGFCQRALADAPFAAGMPLAIETLVDDLDLLLEVAQDFWRREVGGGAPSPELVACLERKKDSPESFAHLLRRYLGKPLARLCWPPEGDSASGLRTGDAEHAYRSARETWLAERGRIVGGMHALLPRLRADWYGAEAIELGAGEWDAAFACNDPLVPLESRGSKLRLYRATTIRRSRAAKTVTLHPFCDLADALFGVRAEVDRRGRVERVALLRRLLREAAAQVRDRKRERRVVAFDDMLSNLHRRLRGPEGAALAATLRSRYPAALIDEFQDTDPQQAAIVDAIYPEPGDALFLIGDPKQAIYAFRHADLYTYLRAKDGIARRGSLSCNQRAGGALVEALNALFGANPRAFIVPGIEFRTATVTARPRPRLDDRSSAAPTAALQVWKLPADGDGAGGPWLAIEARRAAIDATAGEIVRLLGASRRSRIAIGERPLGAGDIAVLVRTHDEGDAVKRALAAVGVGAVELSRASVFGSIDAEEVERVLAAVIDPHRALALRAALATELVGFDAAAIDALVADDVRQQQTFERFSDYRDAWRSKGIGSMYRALLSRERVVARLLARDDGERRLTNLLHLGECLQQAAVLHPEPEALLRWFRLQRIELPLHEALQLRLESDQNLVQIVTIHKSKGLEYPIVFCPFLWSAPWQAPPGRGAVREYHDDDGAAVIDFRGEVAPPDDGDSVKDRIKVEKAAEDLRLLYVALTRAVQRCYLVAGRHARRTASGGRSTKDGDRSLLHWLVAGGGQTFEAWLAGKAPIGPPDLDAAWSALAARAPGDLAVVSLPVPSRPVVPLAPERPDPLALRVPAPPALAPGWRIGSYSGLAWHAESVAPAATADHDGLPQERPPATARPADLDTDDILLFPRGPGAGDVLHAVLERIDFARPDSWPGTIGAALASPLAAVRPRLEPRRLEAMALGMVRDVGATLLGHGFALRDVDSGRRLAELEFVLPAPRLRDGDLNRALAELGYPTPRLAFNPLVGYLGGFIDLVFEHDGRFWLVDWKSNHLGWRAADYAAGPLAAAMVEHAYHLQYLLYTVALDRYLRRRVAGYRYERHFGGVFYLFIRGVRPQWRNDDGTAAGVFFDRPAPAAVARLDRLIAEGG